MYLRKERRYRAEKRNYAPDRPNIEINRTEIKKENYIRRTPLT